MQEENKKTGLDQWNERLDNNLESEDTGNTNADERAKEFSEQEGSGDQSDAPLITPSTPLGPKDGLDNTGTQGYDSLSDDGFVGSSGKEDDKNYDSHTGSSSEDFDDPKDI